MKNIKRMLTILWEKGLFHIMAGTFMTKMVAFFGSIFLVRVLSKQEYGILSYLENIYSYVFVVAGMGVSNAILRYVVLGETLSEKYSYFSYACKRGLIWNCVLIICVVAGSHFFPHPDVYSSSAYLLNVLIFAMPFQYIIDNVLCNERAMFSNQRYAVYSLFFTFSIIMTKVLSGKLGGVVGVVYSQTILYVILAALFYFLTLKRYYIGIKRNKVEHSLKREINWYSIQYMVTNGLWAIFMLNDTFLLGRFGSGPEIIADYKVAYAIPGSVSLLSTAIGIFITPHFVKNEKNIEWIRKNYLLSYISTAVFVGTLCLGLSILAKPIIRILYGEQYLNNIKIMRILLLASFFNCGLRYTTANILAAMGKVKYNMVVSLTGILLQLSINIKIIPLFGAEGIAITSCIVYAIMALFLFFVFIRHYYISGVLEITRRQK